MNGGNVAYLKPRDYDKDPNLMERLAQIDQKLDKALEKIGAIETQNAGFVGRMDSRLLATEAETKKHANEIAAIRKDVETMKLWIANYKGRIAGVAVGAGAAGAVITALVIMLIHAAAKV